MRIRMRGHEVAEFALRLDGPAVFGPREVFPGHDSVHSGSDGTGGVFHADRGDDGVCPVPRFRRVVDGSHAVAFVSKFPIADCFAVLEFADEAADEFHLPFDGKRAVQRVQLFERGGNEQTAAHPAGHEPDDEFESVLFRDLRETAETAEHDGIDAVVASGHFLSFHAESAHNAAPSGDGFNRLEVAPVGEDADQAAADCGKLEEIRFHNFFIPKFPHPRSGVGCPVIASDLHFRNPFV